MGSRSSSARVTRLDASPPTSTTACDAASDGSKSTSATTGYAISKPARTAAKCRATCSFARDSSGSCVPYTTITGSWKTSRIGPDSARFFTSPAFGA